MARNPKLQAALDKLAGTYVFHFSGFDRDDTNARHVTGVGTIVVANDGTITAGSHRATNSPMSGRPATNRGLDNATFNLSGTCTVIDPGPPIVGEIDIKFDRQGGANPPFLSVMWDTFQILQSGPDSFWLISSNPREEANPASAKKVQELVIGEARKVVAGW